jgi:hypothetical protein
MIIAQLKKDTELLDDEGIPRLIKAYITKICKRQTCRHIQEETKKRYNILQKTTNR